MSTFAAMADVYLNWLRAWGCESDVPTLAASLHCCLTAIWPGEVRRFAKTVIVVLVEGVDISHQSSISSTNQPYRSPRTSQRIRMLS